jgi:hypothetical protein
MQYITACTRNPSFRSYKFIVGIIVSISQVNESALLSLNMHLQLENVLNKFRKTDSDSSDILRGKKVHTQTS